MEVSKNILSVKDLTISFGEHKVVKSVSFNMYEGQTLAIVGESGSGKSLTALSLMGLLPQQADVTGGITLKGSLKLNGITGNKGWQKIRGNEIGMIFQEPMSSLNPVMKIGKQLTETILQHQKVSKKEAQKKAIEWLEKVKLPQPNEMISRYPHQLSGGQKQRVMIAMAMCNKPAVLIADEPTTALDVTVQKDIVALMKDLQVETGTSMVFITHDLALASKIADDILVMYRGEVVEQGDINTVIRQPKEPYTQALLACRPSKDQKNKRLPTVQDFLNNEHPAHDEFKTMVSNETILQAQNVRVWFEVNKSILGKTTSYFKAVDDVSFSLKKGEVLGLVGESGCGKSTIGKTIMGLLPLNAGSIQYKGQELAGSSAKQLKQLRKEIQLIFQDPYASLNPRMSIGDTLMEPLAIHNIVPRAERRKEAERLIELVQLPKESMKRYPHQFSGGQRQRIGIARALAVRPKLLICDESVSALDVSVQAQILNLLKELQGELELSYLFISHDLNVVYHISDRVLVMQNGKFVEKGKAEDVLEYPKEDYTKQLINAMP